MQFLSGPDLVFELTAPLDKVAVRQHDFLRYILHLRILTILKTRSIIKYGVPGIGSIFYPDKSPRLCVGTRWGKSCTKGDARITTGGNLKARYVIHTVGPVYHDGEHRAAELLANTYKNSISLASQYKLKSVAFPSISTGAYGYPIHEAARIALKTVIGYLKTHTDIELVYFVLYGASAYQAYEKALQELTK